MSALRKGVALSFGLMAANVSVHSAIEKSKSGNKNCCEGVQGKDPHPLQPISSVNRCLVCQDDVPYGEIVKGREVEGGFVKVEAEEIVEASVDAVALKKRTALTPSPTEQVEAQTVPGEKLYYLTPDPGAETTYAAMRHLVETHPELTFMSLWTPSSRATQFALKVREGCLVMQERVRQENVRAVPPVEAEAPEAMLKMADQVLGLEGIVQDYDPATYTDTYEQKIADIIATKTPVAGQMEIATPGVNTPSTAVAGMDALAAMLANAEASNRKPAKKAAARKKAS